MFHILVRYGIVLFPRNMPSSTIEGLNNCLLDQFYFMSHCIINLLFKGAQSIQFWTMIQILHIINVIRCYSEVHWTLFSIWSIRPVEDIDFSLINDVKIRKILICIALLDTISRMNIVRQHMFTQSSTLFLISWKMYEYVLIMMHINLIEINHSYD